jgi:hypothetical protein
MKIKKKSRESTTTFTDEKGGVYERKLSIGGEITWSDWGVDSDMVYQFFPIKSFVLMTELERQYQVIIKGESNA